MPTEQIIAPTAGNAPFPYQRAVEPGVWEGFDAIDFRRFWSAGYVEGVLSSTAWQVIEHTTPSLDFVVLGTDGAAIVEGDSVADQGLYYVAPHAADVTLTAPAPDATNPRVDRVLLRVRDDEHDGSTEQNVKVEILPGTPTSGATRENEAGAAAVPDSALLLANVCVRAGATTVLNGDILDMRTYAATPARVGDIVVAARTSPLDGEVPADGRALSRKQHARLFAEIDTTYGAGDGSTTFNVPDYEGRSPVGADPTGKRGVVRNPGATGGAASVQLTEAQMPSHNHGYITRASSGGAGTEPAADGDVGASSYQKYVDPVGGNQPHENMPPFVATPVYIFTGSVVG